MNRFTTSVLALAAFAAVASAADKPLVMTKYTVKDVDRNGNQPLMTLLIPKGWKARSEVQWTLASLVAPVAFQARFSDPDGSAAVELFPVLQVGKLSAIPGGTPQGKAGPKDVGEALEQLAKLARPKAKLKVVAADATKAAVGRSQPGTTLTEQTGTLTVAYTVGDTEVEEEFAGTLTVREVSMEGFSDTEWYAHDLRSIKADKGKLADVRPVGVAVVRSARVTPEFAKAVEVARDCVQGIWRHDSELTKLDAELWRRTNKEINDTWRKTTEERWASQDKRFEQMQDLLGGVQRFRSEKGYELLLPQSHTHAWEGPDDTYLLTNDPNYRPDVDLKGTWTRLKAKK